MKKTMWRKMLGTRVVRKMIEQEDIVERVEDLFDGVQCFGKG